MAEVLGDVAGDRNKGSLVVQKNGEFYCGFAKEWQDDVSSKLTETHGMMTNLVEHTAHLPKLSKIADSIETIQDKLLNAATGKDHTENKTVFLILKIFGVVICGLTAVIVYLLTGLHFGFINSLH